MFMKSKSIEQQRLAFHPCKLVCDYKVFSLKSLVILYGELYFVKYFNC